MKQEFYKQNTLAVAKALIGKTLSYASQAGIVGGIINEVEAYTQEDPACHAFNGKKTPRNQIMFKEPGTIYIYFIYGMYHCLNIVTEPEGRGCAVLIRSIIPTIGIEKIKANRPKIKQKKQLCNGPGKVMIGLGGSQDLNGTMICASTNKLQIKDEGHRPIDLVETTRIGIKVGKEKNWRYIANHFNKS